MQKGSKSFFKKDDNLPPACELVTIPVLEQSLHYPKKALAS